MHHRVYSVEGLGVKKDLVTLGQEVRVVLVVTCRCVGLHVSVLVAHSCVEHDHRAAILNREEVGLVATLR